MLILREFIKDDGSFFILKMTCLKNNVVLYKVLPYSNGIKFLVVSNNELD